MNNNSDRLLITGVSGLLGSNLAHYFKDRFEVMGLYYNHPVSIPGIYSKRCDITCSENVKATIAQFDPSIVIHSASLTNIEQCEIDTVVTDQVNVHATRYIVDALRADTRLIYLSTDSVYDGTVGNNREDDNDHIKPINYYGISKLAGELEARNITNSLILRTNIFGWNVQDKTSLGEWILGGLRAGKKINCFHDVFFSSIYTFELARVIDIALRKGIGGIYNCGGSNSCSKYDFALKIAESFALDKNLIHPISVDDFPFRAKRGKNLSLDVDRLQKALDYRLPTIEQSIEAFYRDFKCGMPEKISSGNVQPEKPEYIPYGKQSIDSDDIQSVVNVLRSERLTQGPHIEEFERSLSDCCEASYGVAMNSATSALHAACLSAGVSPGDEVITTPITFVASANCAVYCGARPVFADIDPRTYNIDPKEIEKKINIRTKAIIPVHFAGQGCDMESIHAIVKSAENRYGHKIFVIEDACHALGSLYKNRKIGSCVYSDMTVMSFHPVKHITTGEGGMALTNDAAVYHNLKQIRSHGITSTPDEFINTKLAFYASNSNAQPLTNPWYYEQISLGYNYRITDIQSALGLSQLKKLEAFRLRRKEIVKRYNDAFKNIDCLITPFEDINCESNFHLYVLLFDFDKMKNNRVKVMLSLKSMGIQTQVHYIPVHLQTYYTKYIGTRQGDCPNAENYYRKCLSIPLFPAMTDKDTEKVIQAIFEMTIP